MVVRQQSVLLQLRETFSVTRNKFSRWYMAPRAWFALTPLHTLGNLFLFGLKYEKFKDFTLQAQLCVYTSAGQCFKSFDMQAALGFLVFPRKCAVMSSKCHSTTVKTQFPGVTAEAGRKTFCSPSVFPMQLHRGVFFFYWLPHLHSVSTDSMWLNPEWQRHFRHFWLFPTLFIKWRQL